MANANAYNGIVNVYKPAGFTSFDVVAKLRGIFGMKKIGHTGTLDPDAVGVLPICLGNATKVCELLMDHDKEYIAVLKLGVETDTLDLSGEILATHYEEAQCLTEAAIRDAIMSFVGSYEQLPPMYSALKVGGKRLYELAREGVSVERKTRPVTIPEIEILEFGGPDKISFRVVCSRGTYIRSLCADIGEKLGCGGVMAHLERTRVGCFDKESAVTIEELQSHKDNGTLAGVVQSVASLFPEYPYVPVKEEARKALENGNKLPEKLLDFTGEGGMKPAKMPAFIRVAFPDGTFAGIYKLEQNGIVYIPEKLFL